MKEAGDKVTQEEKTSLDQAVDALKNVLKENDKEAIETKLKDLSDLSEKMADRLYSSSSGHEGTDTTDGGTEGGTTAERSSSAEKEKTDIEDAVFEEVKDKGKKESDKN
jgi:molecular chaperone DnaK